MSLVSCNNMAIVVIDPNVQNSFPEFCFEPTAIGTQNFYHFFYRWDNHHGTPPHSSMIGSKLWDILTAATIPLYHSPLPVVLWVSLFKWSTWQDMCCASSCCAGVLPPFCFCNGYSLSPPYYSRFSLSTNATRALEAPVAVASFVCCCCGGSKICNFE